MPCSLQVQRIPTYCLIKPFYCSVRELGPASPLFPGSSGMEVTRQQHQGEASVLPVPDSLYVKLPTKSYRTFPICTCPPVCSIPFCFLPFIPTAAHKEHYLQPLEQMVIHHSFNKWPWSLLCKRSPVLGRRWRYRYSRMGKQRPVTRTQT